MISFQDLRFSKIVIVGDMIVDHYRMLSPKRLSPEAPVPIFSPCKDEFRPGGAANVAANAIALGMHATLVTVLGHANHKQTPFGSDGTFGSKVIPLEFHPIVAIERGRMTTVKERIVTSRQQVCRIDHQSNKPIEKGSADLLLEMAEETIKAADVIVFSDYDHGVCVPQLVSPIMSIAIKEGIPVVVDSKAKDTLFKYAGATIAVPNMDEAKELLSRAENHGQRAYEYSDQKVAETIREEMGLHAAAITMGPRGIILAGADGCRVFPALEENVEKEVSDVTGAGDTVAATVAAAITLDLPYNRVMVLANVAAGVKVQKRGVATASPEEIVKAASLHGIDL